MTVRTEELETFIRDIQAASWYDLHDNIRNSINGVWSIAAGNTCIDIVRAARLVGPTPWESVPTDLVFGGVWHALLSMAAIGHDDVTPEQEAETVASFDRTGRRIDPAALRDQYAAVIRSMTSARERAYILDEAA